MPTVSAKDHLSGTWTKTAGDLAGRCFLGDSSIAALYAATVATFSVNYLGWAAPVETAPAYVILAAFQFSAFIFAFFLPLYPGFLPISCSPESGRPRTTSFRLTG